jgi:hypothetical protein
MSTEISNHSRGSSENQPALANHVSNYDSQFPSLTFNHIAPQQQHQHQMQMQIQMQSRPPAENSMESLHDAIFQNQIQAQQMLMENNNTSPQAPSVPTANTNFTNYNTDPTQAAAIATKTTSYSGFNWNLSANSFTPLVVSPPLQAKQPPSTPIQAKQPSPPPSNLTSKASPFVPSQPVIVQQLMTQPLQFRPMLVTPVFPVPPGVIMVPGPLMQSTANGHFPPPFPSVSKGVRIVDPTTSREVIPTAGKVTKAIAIIDPLTKTQVLPQSPSKHHYDQARFDAAQKQLDVAGEEEEQEQLEFEGVDECDDDNVSARGQQEDQQRPAFDEYNFVEDAKSSAEEDIRLVDLAKRGNMEAFDNV